MAQRRAWIRVLVAVDTYAAVGELSALFGVSTATVRTDLAALAETGALVRVHGGAVDAPALRPMAARERREPTSP